MIIKIDPLDSLLPWQQKIVIGYRNKLRLFFKKLAQGKNIVSSEQLEDAFDRRANTYTISYRSLVEISPKYGAFFSFIIDLDQRKRGAGITSNGHSRNCNVLIPLGSSEEKVYRTVRKHINGWKKGKDNEHVFQEKFLGRLRSRYPEMILSVKKASREADMRHGVDFTILFLDEQGKMRHVHFNLKSSNNFLAKHKTEFPLVSTFNFVPEDLLDFNNLEERFLAFIFSVEDGVPVHC